MANLWRELRPGPRVPDVVYALVEIPKGSHVKYKFNKENGVIVEDRVLFSALHYPGDYGLIPRTFCEDGDPLDILIITGEPTFPGCVIQARVVGIFRTLDGGLKDDKVLAVPETDPLFAETRELSDVAPNYLREVAHFFQVYKDLEAVQTQVLGWEDAAAAKAEIEKSIRFYNDRFDMHGL